MNPDSALHFEEALTNRYPNWHPTTYSLLVKLSQLIGHWSPAPIVIFQSLIFVTALCTLASSISDSVVTRNVLVATFLAWPQAGYMLVLVGKDGLFTSMFMFMLACIIYMVDRNEPSPLLSALFLISTALFTALRWNGPVAIVWVAICLMLLQPKNRRKVFLFLGAGALVGTVWLVNPLPSDNSGARDLRRGGKALDIAWSLRTDRDSFSPNDLGILNGIAPLNDWADSQANCDNFAMPLLYSVFTENPDYGQALFKSSDEIDRIWRDRLTSHPLNFFSGRLCKIKGLVVPAHEWWPTYEATSQNLIGDFFMVTPTPTLSDSALDRAGNIFDSWGGSSVGLILSMPLTWTAVSALIYMASRRELRLRLRFALISSAIPVSIFIGGVGIEPRYVWPATSTIAVFALGIAFDECRSRFHREIWTSRNGS
jgi:hypothetical protein